MTRKNKLMLAAAIVAAVLLVGSGVARCTLAQNGATEGRIAVESAEEAAVENPQSETDIADGEANSGIESLVGTSWVGVDDATRTLSIVKGAFVETKDGGTEVTYWTLDDEELLSSGIEATVLASKSMTDAARPVLVSVRSDGADTVLRSDALACAYRQVQVGDRSLSFTGVTSKLEEAMGIDAAKIEGREVVVRTCAEGTPFVTLDGVERKLTDKDLMICSAERPMCIAGVFGGLDSGVSDTTTDVFIESAYFNPVWVRKTAKRFGLNTDSSFRFERGIDPNMQVYAAKRAALLMKELAGGTISSGITDIYPEPIGDFVFDISLARVNALIGKEIPETVVRTIIAALEVKILAEKDGVLTVAVPPYRVDVQREADLVEDILRIYGYNNVEIPTQVRSTLSYAPKPDRNRLMNLAADFLTANGFTEIMSNSLTKAAYYEGLTSCPAERCVRILNPLSADLNVMRQTLLFNMLEAVGLNANRRNGDLCLYEFGNCYFYDESKRTDENRLAAYSEEYRLAIAVTGVSTPQSWNAKPVKASFFTLRAVAEKLLRRFGVDIYALKAETLESDLFSEGLTLSLNGKQLLQIGSVAAAIRRRTDVKQDVYYLEMNFEALAKSTKKLKIAAGELSKFPEVRRDLALLVDKSVTFSSLRDAAFAAERKLLKSVSLFDVYEGDKLPEGKKSYALSFILEDKTRTLDERTIERVMANLTRQFEQKCGAQVRA